MFRKILLLVAAFFIPPIVVGILEGFGFHFLLNVVLWLCGCMVLGILHAWLIVLTSSLDLQAN